MTTRCAAMSLAVVLLTTAITRVPAATQAGDARAAPELTVPDGFEVQLVAGPPLVARPRRGARASVLVPDGCGVQLSAGPPLVEGPIVVDFDERGRLYVADSSGSNDKTESQGGEGPHRIVQPTEGDGDGAVGGG